jgi:hypothetical protein
MLEAIAALVVGSVVRAPLEAAIKEAKVAIR